MASPFTVSITSPLANATLPAGTQVAVEVKYTLKNPPGSATMYCEIHDKNNNEVFTTETGITTGTNVDFTFDPSGPLAESGSPYSIEVGSDAGGDDTTITINVS